MKNGDKIALGLAAIEAQAADWYARRDRGFTAEEAATFEVWLREDPRNGEALQAIERSASVVRKYRRTVDGPDVLEEVEARAARRRRMRVVGVLIGCAAVVGLSVTLVRRPDRPVPAPAVAEGTITVKPERRILADGSAVELNAGAEVAEALSPTMRAVRLIRGTAFFSVARDSTRPFVVQVGSVQVRALGTEFTVAVTPTDVDVLVTGGKVAVERSGAHSAGLPTVPVGQTVLAAGERVVVPKEIETAAAPLQVQVPQPSAIQSAQSWRTMRVEFANVPLKEVVERYNRQNATQLALDGDGVGSLRISCVYWLNDPDGFARLLEFSSGLAVDRSTVDRIVIRKP